MNIPNPERFAGKNILLFGIGGGFDVFSGLPFVYHLPNNFVLANYSPSGAWLCRPSRPEEYPEGLIENRKNILAKYSIGRHGPKLVKKALAEIIDDYKIDLILAVDGGVDSLMTGDEQEHGTILEDFISLAALTDFPVDKILCCTGFGTETEENLNHYRVLENMAHLADFFIGAFALTKAMPEFQEYAKQCRNVWKNNRKSHIQTKIIAAVEGKFGREDYQDVDSRIVNPKDEVFISPLSTIFWMYELSGVIRKNKVISTLQTGNTFADAKILLRQFLNNTPRVRDKRTLPL